ncbi:MAG: hypothetical protein F4Z41_00410 [Acidimicrobiia bacterium]|nr:hypothetical protein [bacterium]MXX01321.1 hypothetical protein [Acidimicrobiia bacterium]MXX44649.1 hypothetical protein [Acidimicrobiia bacterium]MXY75439.1 hypothetical protein [Acidimicrobiia bacterium]MYB79322.1 hypothetical protein [Acidimicrobiia bacterium]
MRVFSTGSSDNDPDSSPDALSGLARFLRQGVGQEWRAELEATEFETHQHRLRRRTLRDVAGMLLHRGDRLTVQAGGLRLSGQLTSGGQDYVTITTKHLCADVRLDMVALRVAKRNSGGARAGGMPSTWRARLTQMELTQETVEVHAPSLGVAQAGKIRAVAVDHVWLVDTAGFDFYVPFEEISVVTRALSPY